MAKTPPNQDDGVSLDDIGPETSVSQAQPQSEETAKEAQQFKQDKTAALTQLNKHGGLFSSLFGYGNIATKNAAIFLLLVLAPARIVMIFTGPWPDDGTRFVEWMIAASFGILLGRGVPRE